MRRIKEGDVVEAEKCILEMFPIGLRGSGVLEVKSSHGLRAKFDMDHPDQRGNPTIVFKSWEVNPTETKLPQTK